MPERVASVNPMKYRDECFVLYSIPSYDISLPEILLGKDIGSSKQSIQPQDVLLSKIVPHIRRAWVVGVHESRILASTEWIVFRSEHVLPEYLRFNLMSDDFHQDFMRTTSGVGGSLLRARPSLVANLVIPLPSLDEQQRIVTRLEEQMVTAERARQEAKKQAEAAGAVAAALLRDAFAPAL